MFWKIKKNTTLPNPIEQEITMTTATIVKENAIEIPNIVEDKELIHKYELSKVTGFDPDNPVHYIYDGLREKLFDAGFVWIVKSDFVSKFKYAAGVGHSGIVYEDPQFHSGSSVQYIGDIPDSVIERYDKANKLLKYFSIHSMQPLNVARYKLIDPVMIGWYDYPSILVNGQGEFKQCSKYCMGVVIAVWDGDKEIEVL